MKSTAQRKREKPEVSYTVREVPYEGEVGAGRLIPFPERQNGAVPMAVPDDIPEWEPLGTMTINGTSLERVGIFDQDIVLVRKIFSRKQIKRNTICVCYLPSLGEIVAKKVSFDNGNLVLHYCGVEPQPPLYLPAGEVEIRGIVISVSRHRTEWPFIGDTPKEATVKAKLTSVEKRAAIAQLANRFKPKPSPGDDIPF